MSDNLQYGVKSRMTLDDGEDAEVSIYHIFGDMKQALQQLGRIVLWRAMFGMPKEQFLRLAGALYDMEHKADCSKGVKAGGLTYWVEELTEDELARLVLTASNLGIDAP